MASVVRAAGKAPVSLVPPVAAAGLPGCGAAGLRARGRGELGVGVPVRSLWGAHALGKRMPGTGLRSGPEEFGLHVFNWRRVGAGARGLPLPP